MKNKYAQEMGRLSHKKSPRSKELYKLMGNNSVKSRFTGKSKEEISEIMKKVRNEYVSKTTKKDKI